MSEKKSASHLIDFSDVPDDASDPNYLPAVMRLRENFSKIPLNLITADICLAAVKKAGNILYCVPEELLTHDICMAAVLSQGWAIQHVPDVFRSEELCIAAVVNHFNATHHLSNKEKSPRVCLEILRHGAIFLDSVSPSHISLALNELPPGQLGDDFILSLEESINNSVYKFAIASDALAIIRSAKVARSMTCAIQSVVSPLQSSEYGVNSSPKRRRVNV